MTQVSVVNGIVRPRGLPGAIPGPRSSVHDVLPDVLAPVRAAGRGLRTPWMAASLDVLIAAAMASAAVAMTGLRVEVAVLAAATWPLLLAGTGHYRPQPLGESATMRLCRVLATGGKAALVALAAVPWVTGAVEPVGLLLLVAALSVASSVPCLLSLTAHRPRMVLAGHPRLVREAMVELLAADRHQIVALCLTRETKTPFGDLPIYVGMGQAALAAGQHGADALVVLPGARLSSASMRRLEWAAAGVGTQLYVGTGLLDVAPARTRVLATAGLDVLHVAPAVLRGPRRVVKQVAERLAAALGLLLMLPVLVVVALVVRLDSPGPAMFRQQRIGRGGKPFTMLKFRSMSTTAERERTELLACNESDGGVLFKMQEDPRVTRVGALLRRYSLDELPQLWNIVRGDMSLVGPRPALPEEVALYDLDPRRRLLVKPGLTGLWQVSGRSDLSWEESVRLDLRYVENWSLRLDVWILVRTFRAVLGHQGAY